MEKRTAVRIAAGIGAFLLVAVVAGVFVLTMTDIGRERVRLFSVGELEKRINGRVSIGTVKGNLLSGATLIDVSITDPEGRPFLSADTISLRYSIRSLFDRHLVFQDVRLVRPVVVFDQPPGEEWNASRVFPSDTVVVPGDTVPGFGDWVRIEDLTVLDGTITVKREWSPADADTAGAVAEALAPDSREMIAAAPGGGFQSISSFHEVYGGFPLLRLADPDSAARVVVIDSLRTLALPFRPPAAHVQDMEGRLTITRNTLGFHDVRVDLPDSRLRLSGSYDFTGGERVSAQIHGQPVSLPDLRWLRPSLPEGGGRIDLTVAREEGRTLLVAREMDLRVGGGRLRGFAEIETGEGGTRVERSDVRFEGLDTRTVERLDPGLTLPVDGVLAGHVRLSGTSEELDVDGRATVRERSGAVSTIEADGVVANRPGGVVARDLRLRFAPLRMTLARSVFPDVPLDGAVTGRALLNGPLDGLFAVDADLVHTGSRAGRSRVAAEGRLRVAGGVLARDLDLVFDPVQARLVRVFAPDFPVGGTLTGRATVDGELGSVFSLDADVVHRDPVLGRSDVRAVGGLRVARGLVARDLRLELDPLRTELIRVFDPDFPLEGTVSGRATLDGDLEALFQVDADLVHRDPALGRSDLTAVGGVRLIGGLAGRNLRLGMDPLRADVIRLFAPDFPLEGTLAGRATLDGDLESMFQVDADLVHESEETGRSHVVGQGGLRLAGGVAARDLKVRMDPLQVALARVFDPGIPLDGTLEGSATVGGTLSTRIAASLDGVTHRGFTGVSELTGDVAVAFSDGIRDFDVDVRGDPLSLETVGLFAPRADLHGSVTGSIVARGTPERATLDVDLDVADGGEIVARGTFGIGPSAGYDLRTRLVGFDASAVTGRGPPTALTGFIDIEGVGTDLATARAEIDASLVDSELEGTPRMDSTRVVARIDDGLATFERGKVRLASARADVEGTFGLVAGRRGELRYSVTVDSLSRFGGLIPADTGVVQARPLPRSRALAAAREDSARAAEDALVESLATGRPTPPAAAVDTMTALPRDSVSGSVHAKGVLVGNLEAFDTRGVAELEDVVAGGARVGTGVVEYDVRNVLAPEQTAAVLDAELTGVRVAGLDFADVTVSLDHSGGRRDGSGRVEVDLTQDEARDYRLSAEYDLALDRSELRLEEVVLHFDSTRWESTGPGFVRWAGRGLEIEHIELVNDRGGRVFADGSLPDGEPGVMRLEADSVRISHLAALLQDTVDTRGLLSLDARMTGTLASPRIEGTAVVDGLQRGGEMLSTVRADFEYADRELTAHTEIAGADRTLLEGDIRLPVDLALTDRQGPLLLEGGGLTADLRLDSLPLESLPLPPEHVTDLHGRLWGDVEVRGSVTDPELTGDVRLVLESAHVVGPSITLADGGGAFRLRGRTIYVDSLLAHSGGGPIRANGLVELESLQRPELDLVVTARDAIILDRGDDRLRADLDIDVQGPLRELLVNGGARVTSGELRVPEPERYRRFTRLDDPVLVDVLDTLGIPPEMRPHNPLLDNVRADLSVRIDRDTWLRNQDLDVEVYTPLHEPALTVRTDPDTRSFSILGVVHTDRGSYTFAGRELELNSGSVTFLGEEDPDPLLQLNAQHEVPRRGAETLVVLIAVSGYLSEPRLSLSSNQQPPLPESDLLSYLAFGQSSSSLLASEGSGLMGDALGGLGVLVQQQAAGLGLGALTDAFVSRLERRGAATGLDLFRVQPGAVPDELNYGGYLGNFLQATQVEAGEYLGERFFVLARVRPFEQTLPGLQVEYRTPAGLSWITNWDLRYLPSRPTLGTLDVSRSRVFGSFLKWRWRY